MSDVPGELEVKLQRVVLAVSDVADWFNLGLQLGLPSATLEIIASDPSIKDIKSKRLAMLSEWLKYNRAASWEKLAAALDAIGENVVSANVRSQFMKIPTAVTDDAENGEDRDEIGLCMRQTIRGQFSSLLDKVQSALQANQVSVDRVRHFLIRYFRSDIWVKKTSNLGELFDAVSVAKLWNYDHYGPLEEIVTQLLPGNSHLIDKYKNQLNAYYTATKITDFIRQSKIEADLDEQDPDKKFDVKRFKEYYRKLKVRLNLKRKISETTMSHVDLLWRSLAKEFDLPCLTAVIHSIVTGSLEVIWIILPHVAEHMISKAKALDSEEFCRNNDIVELKIDDFILYSNKCPWMVHATQLYQASFIGNMDEVKELLEGGVNVNEPNDDNQYRETALFGACRGGHVEIARVLLDHSAIVDQQNKYGQSTLWVASDVGAMECVKLLLKYGAQVDLSSGGTGLMWASDGGYMETVCVLLEAKADPNITDKWGGTALHDAASNDHAEVIQLLMKHGASMDIRDMDGETALHDATMKGYVAAVKTLVECGASVDIRNTEGLTALEIARGAGEEAIIEVLAKYTKQETEVTEEQRESIYQRLLKMLERTFLKEQVKKREEQQKEHHHQREERVRGEREKRSLWNRLRGRRDRPGQIIGTAPAPEK